MRKLRTKYLHSTVKGFGSDQLRQHNRELKQRGRRRLRKRYLKSEFALPQALSRLYHLVSLVKRSQILELNSKGLYPSSRNEKNRKKGCRRCLRSLITDRRVSSYDSINNCGTHFGSIVSTVVDFYSRFALQTRKKNLYVGCY